MADPETYHDPTRAAQVARTHRELKARLESTFDEWAEVSEALEG